VAFSALNPVVEVCLVPVLVEASSVRTVEEAFSAQILAVAYSEPTQEEAFSVRIQVVACSEPTQGGAFSAIQEEASSETQEVVCLETQVEDSLVPAVA